VVLASLSDTITTAVANHGVYAVFGLMAIDAVFPAASELVMLYAGAVAAGAFSATAVSPASVVPVRVIHNGIVVFGTHVRFGAGAFVVVALSGTLGYLFGALVGWGIGRYGGRPLLEQRGRWFHLSPAKLDKAEAWFERWGNLGVALGRITPIVRSFVSIPAGVFEMPLVPYTFLTLVGSAIWAFALSGAGYALGTSYHGADHAFRYLEYAVVAGVVVFAAYLVYRWRTKAKVEPNAEDPAR
jgi:membrane protein DedA with SNARE-associated domain